MKQVESMITPRGSTLEVTNIEELVKKYIQKHAEFFKRDRALSAFYKWQASIARSESVVPMKNVGLDVRASMKTYLGLFGKRPQPKQCFENALNMLFCGGKGLPVSYVEGYYVSNGRIFSHAWNSYKGKYFDVTVPENEKHLPRELRGTQRHYIKIVELNALDAFGYSFKAGGELQIQHYLRLKKLSNSALDRGWRIVENNGYLHIADKPTQCMPDRAAKRKK